MATDRGLLPSQPFHKRLSWGEGTLPSREFGEGCSSYLAGYLRLWIQPPTRWRLRGPFHDTRGKADRNETGEFQKAPTAHTSHPRAGGQGPPPQRGLLRTLLPTGLSDGDPARDARLHRSSRTRPSPASPVRLRAWRAGTEPRGDGGSCPEEGAGIDSHGLWRPLQTLSGKVVTECHDFRSAGGGAPVWGFTA